MATFRAPAAQAAYIMKALQGHHLRSVGTVRKLAGDMLHHRLHGLTLHVQSLLADLLPALLQVADSQLGGHRT